MKKLRFFAAVAALLAFSGLLSLPAQEVQKPADDQSKIVEAMHLVSSNVLYDYVKELVSEKYGGRLTGTREFEECAAWVESLLRKWGVQPAGENGTYRQNFPNPYTRVFPGGECVMLIPEKKDVIKKSYRYEDEFIPGGTSGSGELTADVVYVGYGITAPELGYDDYKGVDVKGRIVLMDSEVPVSPGEKTLDLFMKWRPYSFHQYKLKNAVAHGAKGMLYNYGPIGNPNNAYVEGFIYHHVGLAVVNDVFAGTDKTYRDTVAKIRKDLKPQPFDTGKTFMIKNVTEHHPEGVGFNVLGAIPGTDPVLKDEVILIAGHLDHLGRMWEMMPGANDNATAVAVGLGIAEAMAKCAVKPKRTVVFAFFGSEEQSEVQGVTGSRYYTEHPLIPLDKIVVMINMEGPGSGDKISASGGKTYPAFWSYIEKANNTYIHRTLSTGPAAFPGRPREDAAWFFWKGVPALTFGSYGFNAGRPTYHTPHDNISVVTPEIMEDIAQLLFMAVMDMSGQPALNFR